MDDLRRDVNEAFDKRQAELGDLGGARERILKGALGARSTRAGYRLHFAAGVAVILIAALVVATFVYVRAISQPTPGTHLKVTADTPMILYHDPSNFDQIDGITWDGRTSVRIGQGDPNGGTSNPAGTLYSTSTEIRDRSGNVVVNLKGFTGTWADDERQFCEMVPSGLPGAETPADLMLVTPGASPLRIATIGTYPAAGANHPPPIVAACSVANDTVIVVQAGGLGAQSVQYWAVQLSNGGNPWSRASSFTDIPAAFRIVATHDGRFVAESTLLPSQVTANINSATSSKFLTSSVDAFSWDGSLAVVAPLSGTPVSLVRWRDGTVLWTGPVGSYFRAAKAEPGGSRIAIGLVGHNPAELTAVVRTVNLYVVSAEGRLIWTKNNMYLA